ncbi:MULTISPECIES: RNA polymerase subunit sigma [Sporosarcina]|uniref:RNA polymerase subunit sigma n=1 Tax=Sporosarcina contaminans TaxID=633403 RepID=A0ABW3TUV9_9BACL
MSLKSIELQIAIPKTFEAGKVAEQKQQQSQLNQDLANALTEKRAEKMKESVMETEEYAKTNPDRKNDQQQNEQKQNEKRKQEEEMKTIHPYKGSFVDFTG